MLSSKNMVISLPDITPPSKTCESCVVAKYERDSFPFGKSRRAQTILELVHLDLCGSISPASSDNKKYFKTRMDDFSRKTWIYFLRTKSEAFNYFKNFCATMKTKTGRRVKTLKTNRGGEFCSNEFTKFCEREGHKEAVNNNIYTTKKWCDRKEE